MFFWGDVRGKSVSYCNLHPSTGLCVLEIKGDVVLLGLVCDRDRIQKSTRKKCVLNDSTGLS